MLKRLLFMSVSAALFSTGAMAGFSTGAMAGSVSTCPTLSINLKSALQNAISQAAGALGLGLNMWATVVAPDGHVCYVTYSSSDAIQGQWLASRVISAQKAFTAATLSLETTSNSGSGTSLATGKLALSTANLYSAVQPGGSLYGLQHSNPVFAPGAYGDTLSIGGAGVQTASLGADGGALITYEGPVSTATYGTAQDPMIGQIIGGINVFGGGLALYANVNGVDVKVGGLGVSGDTSCQDHQIAWNLRHNLNLDHLGSINGVAGGSRPDNIIYDIVGGVSASGFGHPVCGVGQTNSGNTTAANGLPAVRP